jgi:hypothetical protein
MDVREKVRIDESAGQMDAKKRILASSEGDERYDLWD